MLKRIHINSKRLVANRKLDRAPEPVIIVRTHRRVYYGNHVEIKGSSTVVYRPEAPLRNGAQAWIETRAPVLIDGAILIL